MNRRPARHVQLLNPQEGCRAVVSTDLQVDLVVVAEQVNHLLQAELRQVVVLAYVLASLAVEPPEPELTPFRGYPEQLSINQDRDDVTRNPQRLVGVAVPRVEELLALFDDVTQQALEALGTSLGGGVVLCCTTKHDAVVRRLGLECVELVDQFLPLFLPWTHTGSMSICPYITALST